MSDDISFRIKIWSTEPGHWHWQVLDSQGEPLVHENTHWLVEGSRGGATSKDGALFCARQVAKRYYDNLTKVNESKIKYDEYVKSTTEEYTYP